MTTEPHTRQTPTCRHCRHEIEPFNGYDYADRGATWRHFGTKSIWCRMTTAEPVPADNDGTTT